ncbi:MAG: HEAT repeat domain-containing protein, partial [Acidobacteria bacterium]|nr:HEAT repeat domain-containing protein [Acidobacteriota bacterium]
RIEIPSMSRDRSNDPPKSAAELMAELQGDRQFQARRALQAQQQRENLDAYNNEAGPLLAELAEKGFPVSSVGQLRQEGKQYSAAVPALLRWLPQISNRAVKEDVVRTLSVPWARPAAGPALVQAFREASDSGLRWAIANGLAVVAEDEVFEDIAELARNRAFGKSRQMLAVALGNMTDPRAVPLLLDLLEDEETVGHAVIGLGKLGATVAESRLRNLTAHPTKWVREEAKKALGSITTATVSGDSPKSSKAS